MIRSGRSKFCGKTPSWTEAKIVPVRPAVAAPNMNASSFSRFTGMLIISAASESSRSARHARPVREWLMNCSATTTTAKTPSESQR